MVIQKGADWTLKTGNQRSLASIYIKFINFCILQLYPVHRLSWDPLQNCNHVRKSNAPPIQGLLKLGSLPSSHAPSSYLKKLTWSCISNTSKRPKIAQKTQGRKRKCSQSSQKVCPFTVYLLWIFPALLLLLFLHQVCLLHDVPYIPLVETHTCLLNFSLFSLCNFGSCRGICREKQQSL